MLRGRRGFLLPDAPRYLRKQSAMHIGYSDLRETSRVTVTALPRRLCRTIVTAYIVAFSTVNSPTPTARQL